MSQEVYTFILDDLILVERLGELGSESERRNNLNSLINEINQMGIYRVEQAKEERFGLPTNIALIAGNKSTLEQVQSAVMRSGLPYWLNECYSTFGS